MKKILSLVLSFAAIVGCAQKFDNPASSEPAGQEITITFSAAYPQAGPDSKVTIGTDSLLQWTGTETAKLIFGNTTTIDDVNAFPVLSSIAPGVFGGKVTIPAGYTMENLVGVVIPADSESNFRYKDTQKRIRMYIRGSQTYNGEIDWTKCPFFTPMTSADLQAVDGTNYNYFGELALKSGADLLKFTVFGKHDEMEEGEKLVSVKVEPSSSYLSNILEYDAINNTFVQNNIDTAIEVSVAQQPVLTGEDVASGVEVWGVFMSVYDRKIAKAIVTTDKATYTKTVDVPVAKKDVTKLAIYPLGLDISTFTRAAK